MVQSNLIGLRKTKQVNQQKIADLIGVSIKTYSDKELGKIQFKCNEMFTIARYFNLTVDDIFLPTLLQNGVKENR